MTLLEPLQRACAAEGWQLRVCLRQQWRDTSLSDALSALSRAVRAGRVGYSQLRHGTVSDLLWARRVSLAGVRSPHYVGASYGDGAVVCVRLPPNQQDDSAISARHEYIHISRLYTHTLSRAHTHYSLASALVPQHFNERISQHIPMSDSYVNRYFDMFPSPTPSLPPPLPPRAGAWLPPSPYPHRTTHGRARPVCLGPRTSWQECPCLSKAFAAPARGPCGNGGEGRRRAAGVGVGKEGSKI